MKLFRFMSFNEGSKLLKGETLKNNTDHSLKRGSASTAKGFCFGIGDEEQAKKAFRRLKGDVYLEFLFVFTLKPESESHFTKCKGTYVDYDKIDAEKKTIDHYPFGLEPKCIVDEYYANSYSFEDLEDVHVYHIFADINKDPSDKDFLELRKLGILPVDGIGGPDLDKGREVANEIIRLINSKSKNAGQTFMALSIAVSSSIDTFVEQSDFSRRRCLSDFVCMLHSFVFPECENQ